MEQQPAGQAALLNGQKGVPTGVVDGQVYEADVEIAMAHPVEEGIVQTKSCLLCGEERDIREFYKLPCGHMFRLTCLKDHVIQELQD